MWAPSGPFGPIYDEEQEMPNKETKVCSKEGVEKPIDAFHKDVSSSDGYSSACAKCRNAAKRNGSKRVYKRDQSRAPETTEKPVEQREEEALAKCHIAAYKNLRQLYPETFRRLLEDELKNNPIMIARKWRQLPETEGV